MEWTGVSNDKLTEEEVEVFEGGRGTLSLEYKIPQENRQLQLDIWLEINR